MRFRGHSERHGCVSRELLGAFVIAFEFSLEIRIPNKYYHINDSKVHSSSFDYRLLEHIISYMNYRTPKQTESPTLWAPGLREELWHSLVLIGVFIAGALSALGV